MVSWRWRASPISSAAGDAARGLAVAAELCSLAFHAGGGASNYVASLIFADGAGAARVETGAAAGFEIVDALSVLLPNSEGLLGFDLTDAGSIRCSAMSSVMCSPGRCRPRRTACSGATAWWAQTLRAGSCTPAAPAFSPGWRRRSGFARDQTRWSWESMRAHGNTSSASIFDVIARAFAQPAVGEWHVAAAFGPVFRSNCYCCGGSADAALGVRGDGARAAGRAPGSHVATFRIGDGGGRSVEPRDVPNDRRCPYRDDRRHVRIRTDDAAAMVVRAAGGAAGARMGAADAQGAAGTRARPCRP